MSITTLDGALAGMQPLRPFAKAVTPTLTAGLPQSLWYLAGNPGAGSAPGATTAGGTALSSSSALVNGQIPHTDPSSGNSYLGRFSGVATQSGLLLLCDRLLHDGANSAGSAISMTSTSAQTINTTTLPARDINGATAGAGVLAGIEISTATGSSAPSSITLGYTNSGGTTGRSATNINAAISSAPIGSFFPIGLQAGDVGIQEVTSLTLGSTWTSGALAIVLYRVLAALELPGNFIPNAIDALTSGFPQLFNGVVPFLIFVPNTTTASLVSGTYTETQG
jgi:hypothetical protein